MVEQKNENPYEFILNPEKPKKVAGPQFQSNSKKMLVIVGFLVGITIAIIVGFTLFFNLTAPNNADLIELRAYQTELERVITLGQKNLTETDTKNRIASLSAVLQSDSTELDGLIKKKKMKITKTELGSKKDAGIDKALEAAKQNNAYDKEFLTVIQSLSTNYYKSLKAALADSKSKSETALLEKSIADIEAVAQ